ncbi:hypothetical protein NE235_00850 [Actinoallomurus spadix]|uniref:Uncharacterized protein n=1 Tax=Actinoallomurus spadix TaxID=79912 RepID=A0ABP3GF33_9ACTN|nr:hypothetical protein [Actinoallomurus spadix]MCO5984646.1 hypothetical protein [Actinoallomurus spadix]
MSGTGVTPGTTARTVTGVVLLLLTLGWIGGTIALLLAAYDPYFCFANCRISERQSLHSDRLLIASAGCAIVLPLAAAVLCAATRRWVAAVVLLVAGVVPGIVFGLTVGVGAARDVHRIQLRQPASLPSGRCPCHSGGGCDCPGG